jgi:hypothetical protein
MQIGQVPIQFIPDGAPDVAQAVTMETQNADIAIPSLAPFMPEAPPALPPAPTVPPWIWLAIGVGVLWLMRKR